MDMHTIKVKGLHTETKSIPNEDTTLDLSEIYHSETFYMENRLTEVDNKGEMHLDIWNLTNQRLALESGTGLATAVLIVRLW